MKEKDITSVTGFDAADMDPVKTMSVEQQILEVNQISERRYDSLDKRVKTLERRGMFLPDIEEENIFFYLGVIAVVANFILPAVVRLFTKEETKI